LHRDIPELRSVEASNGEEAIEKINTEDGLVAVVVEQAMNGVDGMDVLRHLAQSKPNVGGILVRDDSEIGSPTEDQFIIAGLKRKISIVHRFGFEAMNKIIDKVRESVWVNL
jgi:CheY-like chemotaxis protein